ncbi:WD40/YVTN/BNR-like repeat-containing protein [Alicyclobacillus tolerans]|uniref:Uncharacterized protein n=1 Tax=Alicyclobacillus tolerans TaxID=90970 RepID=A0A1M6WIZ8_9BACL|nr:hypothetical protein [Alicyclobacillus montanus]SHK93596.1 hypothetical protein SAMN05443507_1285 [Alicyclobacillus montanus]
MQKRIWGLTASMLALTCLTVTGCGIEASPHSLIPKLDKKNNILPIQLIHNIHSISSMVWESSKIGYLSTSVGILRTEDSGQNWYIWYPSHTLFRSLATTSPNTVWALSDSKIIEFSGVYPKPIHSLDLSTDQSNQIQSVNQLKSGSNSLNSVRLYENHHQNELRNINIPQNIEEPNYQMRVFQKSKGFILLNGTMYVFDNNKIRTLSLKGIYIQSMFWADPEIGYAASGPYIWKTLDGGKTWTIIFKVPVLGSSWSWSAKIVANNEKSVWILLNGESSADNPAYILFHSENSGHSWEAIAYDAFDKNTSYPKISHPLAQDANHIIVPGPITTIGNNGILFTGWIPENSNWVGLEFSHERWQTLYIANTMNVDVPQVSSSDFLEFTSLSTGWLFGENGDGTVCYLKTDNSGQNWGSHLLFSKTYH